MKKIILSLITIFALHTAQAQTPFSLSGTNYTQTFDNIGAGLPLGWRVDTMVNKNAGLGNNAISRFSNVIAPWSNTSRGFKNIASADGLTAGATSTDQSASTDRALGLRQVSSAGWDDKDSLSSFSFYIANTSGLNTFALQFKLQSLHTTAYRYNNWIVQYGIGASPATFTTVATTPTTVTIDSNFSNTTVAVNFGTSLDNQNQPVWIRIMPSDTTMGSGNRPMVGLDDFNLTWSGTAVNNTPQVVVYNPSSGQINVPIATTNLTIEFDKNITIGTGNVTINNITDATNQVITAGTCTAAGMVVTIPGVTLLNGKQYAVQYDSTCFKWNTFSCLGVYNNTNWTFITELSILPPTSTLNESFVGCFAPMFGTFKEFNTLGSQTWRCSNFGRNDTDAVYMNGFVSGATQDNEDWLISPALDLSSLTAPYVHFWSKKRFSGSNTKELMVSNNFVVDPGAASWNNLNVNLASLDTTYKLYNNNNLNAYKSSPLNIAFKYVSVSTGTSDEWSIDDVYVTDGPVGVLSFEQAGLDVLVLGNVTNQLPLQLRDANASEYVLTILDAMGNVIAKTSIQTTSGKNMYSIPTANLASGMYILNVKNANVNGNVKFVKQ